MCIRDRAISFDGSRRIELYNQTTGLLEQIEDGSSNGGFDVVAVGAERRYDGPMGNSDRAFVFGALGTWVAVAAPLPALAAWVMPVIAALLAWTVFNRVRRGLQPAA